MNHYGVILRKLRELNKIPLKQAAIHIKKSAGWLSEIENGKGSARIGLSEFERIVAAYNGEPYRKQFGIWVATSHKPVKSTEVRLEGVILKYLRGKSKITLDKTSAETGLSKSYLSYPNLKV